MLKHETLATKVSFIISYIGYRSHHGIVFSVKLFVEPCSSKPDVTTTVMVSELIACVVDGNTCFELTIIRPVIIIIIIQEGGIQADFLFIH